MSLPLPTVYHSYYLCTQLGWCTQNQVNELKQENKITYINLFFVCEDSECKTKQQIKVLYGFRYPGPENQHNTEDQSILSINIQAHWQNKTMTKLHILTQLTHSQNPLQGRVTRNETQFRKKPLIDEQLILSEMNPKNKEIGKYV